MSLGHHSNLALQFVLTTVFNFSVQYMQFHVENIFIHSNKKGKARCIKQKSAGGSPLCCSRTVAAVDFKYNSDCSVPLCLKHLTLACDEACSVQTMWRTEAAKIFGTYAGKLSFFPLSTFVKYK